MSHDTSAALAKLRAEGEALLAKEKTTGLSVEEKERLQQIINEIAVIRNKPI